MELYTILADLHWSLQAALLFVPYLLFCWLTRNVDKGTMDKSLAEVAGFFVYEEEQGIEGWKVLSPDDPEGDCEDAVLTAVKGTGGWFMWRVCNIFAFRLWYAKDPLGNDHMIGVCKHGGFENHQMKLTPVAQYEAEGYKFRFPAPFPMILLKLAIGKFK